MTGVDESGMNRKLIVVHGHTVIRRRTAKGPARRSVSATRLAPVPAARMLRA